MIPDLTLTVRGMKPVPQGSKNVYRGIMVDQNKGRIDEQRAAFREVFEASGHPGFGDCILEVDVEYIFQRPNSHFVANDRTRELKANAPTLMGTMPDRDKLDRAVNDALTIAGVWKDDSRNAVGASRKRYQEVSDGGIHEEPGIVVTIRYIGERWGAK